MLVQREVGEGKDMGREERFCEEIVGCYLYMITRYGYPPPAEDTLSHLEEYHRLGFRSAELEGIREDHLKAMHAQRFAIRDQAEGLGLKIPVFCIVLPGLGSPDPVEREKNLFRFSTGCVTASALGARMVLDNSPLPPWQFPGGIPVARHYDDNVLASATLPPNLDWDYYWRGLVETFREACDIAASHGMNYLLHPCQGALVDSTDSFLHFAGAVKRDNLKFNLDTANQHFLKDNIFLSLIRLRNHVQYIHLSDNGGMKMEHLAIGDGQIPWDRFFETLDRIGYSGWFGIDIGGAESLVPDLDRAYREAAGWLTEKWFNHKK